MMLVLEEREAVATTETPTRAPARSETRPLPCLVPEAPLAQVQRPDVNLGLTRGPTQQWNSPHGQAMRAVEAILALGVMAYFGAGLMGVLGII